MQIQSTPEDVINGFKYLKHVLYRRSDELNGAVRDFYERLKNITGQKGLQRFKIADVRKELAHPPRTIQHYFRELLAYDYVQVTGGKKATGYEYELSQSLTEQALQAQIESHIESVMQRMEAEKKPGKKSRDK